MPIPARPLHSDDLDPDPFVQFRHWYDDAVAHGQESPENIVVATSTPDGHVSVRFVLLRGADDRGFAFYTNLDSRKARELTTNPRAAIALHWTEVQRQVRAVGSVERVADAEADAYWYGRPRASRVSAWASAQSEPVASRADLEARVEAVEQRFAAVDVPRPSGWGGFRLVPDELEFWQHRDDRLHDRFAYRRRGTGWHVTRLQP